MNDTYPIDIWHVIFHHCDLLSQLKLTTLCSDFHKSFFITDLYNITRANQKKLTKMVFTTKKI